MYRVLVSDSLSPLLFQTCLDTRITRGRKGNERRRNAFFLSNAEGLCIRDKLSEGRKDKKLRLPPPSITIIPSNARRFEAEKYQRNSLYNLSIGQF